MYDREYDVPGFVEDFVGSLFGYLKNDILSILEESPDSNGEQASNLNKRKYRDQIYLRRLLHSYSRLKTLEKTEEEYIKMLMKTIECPVKPKQPTHEEEMDYLFRNTQFGDFNMEK